MRVARTIDGIVLYHLCSYARSRKIFATYDKLGKNKIRDISATKWVDFLDPRSTTMCSGHSTRRQQKFSGGRNFRKLMFDRQNLD